MGTTTTLYRFQIELADIQRSVYETLDLRVAQHPSETLPYLLTRVLAFALNTTEGLAFSPGGLSDPDAAALSAPDAFGGYQLWIEIGNPSARKLHKASKAAREVKVYTYKNPEPLLREIRDEKVHRADELKVLSISNAFLSEVSSWLERDNRWSLINDDGLITVHAGDKSASCELSPLSLQG